MSRRRAKTEVEEHPDGSVTVRYWSRLSDAETYHFHRTSYTDDRLVHIVEQETAEGPFENITYTSELLNRFYDHPEFQDRDFEGPVDPDNLAVPVDVKVELEDRGFEIEECELF